ncbi:hypothetical protein UFOVP276_244, partial [uncultured Caudovirales phage]
MASKRSTSTKKKIIKKTEYKLRKGKALVLRTCDKDLRSYNGFQWPKSGFVKCTDWVASKECGNGLHGLLWGEGDGSLLSTAADAKWLVVEIDLSQAIDLGDKVKFPCGEVVFVGDVFTATEFIKKYSGPGISVAYSTNTGGDSSKNTGGYSSKNTGGDSSTNTGEDSSKNTGGNYSTNTGGYSSTNTGGYSSKNTGGNYSTNTGGYSSTNTGGYSSTNTGGYSSKNTGGNYSTNTGGDSSKNTGGYSSKNTGGNYSTNTGGYSSTNTGGYSSTNTGGYSSKNTGG